MRRERKEKMGDIANEHERRIVNYNCRGRGKIYQSNKSWEKKEHLKQEIYRLDKHTVVSTLLTVFLRTVL